MIFRFIGQKEHKTHIKPIETDSVLHILLSKKCMKCEPGVNRANYHRLEKDNFH